MLHTLYTLPPGKTALTATELKSVGIDCDPDTIEPLVVSGAVNKTRGRYTLSNAARKILATCIVANRRWQSDEVQVDGPSAFVVMPFSEPWSDRVYRDLINRSVRAAQLRCVKGDLIVRIGDLSQNVWNALLKAGVVVADVSALNANVFYEIGLAHALGKDVFILKQRKAKVPADFGAAHYIEYDLKNLNASRAELTAQLKDWATKNHVREVKALVAKN